MGSPDLGSYANRLTALCERCAPETRAETTSWVLRPLLEELGWDPGSTRPGTAVGLLADDLVASVGTKPPTPALIVAGEATEDPLSTDRAEAISTAMRRTGIDRAIYANGRDFLFFAGTGDDRLRLATDALSSRSDDLAPYARETVRHHCEELDPETRAVRRLAAFRDEIADSIASLIESRVGPAGMQDAEMVRGLLDAVDSSVAEGADAGRSPPGSDVPQGSGPNPGTTSDSPVAASPRRSGSDSSTQDRSPGTPEDETGPSREVESIPSSVPPRTDPAGEYVVRVFNERGSIGAVGHSTSAGAVAEAASYFFDRGLSGIRIPWGPEDGSIVINEEPVDEAGTRWSAYERLANGLYVYTGGSVEDRAGRVQALADRAGLRVLLTGDWSGATR